MGKDKAVLEIPEKINGTTVTEIGTNAFVGCTNIASISLPNTISKIPFGVFLGCNNIVELKLPFIGATEDDTITNHLGYAFGATSSSYNEDYVPSSLKRVTIESGSIKTDSFRNCYNLTSVTLKNGVTSIGENAFKNFTNLTSVSLPSNLSILPIGLFYGCSALTSISLPRNLSTISSDAFYGCSALTSTNLPNSVNEISQSAFKNCSSLTKITIPLAVTYMFDNVFENCSNLSIYCKASSCPSTWSTDWNPSNCPVYWGQ